MRLSEPTQELLETLWEQSEEGSTGALAELEEAPGFEQLSQMGYITVVDGELELTERGLPEAEAVIRRHRLAERLMADVLDVGPASFEAASCQLEHILYAELEDKVCQLLGHPRLCPHGKPIPEGRCCRERAQQPVESAAPGRPRRRMRRGGREGAIQTAKLVAPLTDIEIGEGGRVAYLSTHENSRMRELMAIGLVPGMEIRLLRRSPAYVFSVGESEFAVDEEMAKAVYVRMH